MTIYRLKPPTFEARQFTGCVNCLVNGFFEWLGEGAKVVKADANQVRISIPRGSEHVELNVGDWAVKDRQYNGIVLVKDEDFRRDFEVDE